MININPTDKLVFELELLPIDYNEQKKETLRHEISNKYNVPLKNVEVVFKPLSIDKNGDKVSLTSDIIKNIQDPSFQVKLFKEYIDLNNIEDIDFSEIEKIDSQINSYIDFDSYSKYKSYKFKYVKWDNYLSYGSGNYFDFTNLNGLILLNGNPENQCGKTTFAIDLLRFALFGKAQKSPTLDSVFNVYLPEETHVMVEAGLEIDGEDYVIRRTVTRPVLSKRTKKSKCKQNIEYFRILNGNYELIENCEGESSTQTNNIIKEAVGNVEDFNLVISATAYNLGDLIRMGQSDKGKLFSRWLGLLTIEKKEEIAKDLWKKQISPKLLSNTYNKKTLSDESEDFLVCIKSDEKYISESEKLQIEAMKNIEQYNNEKMEILSNMKPIRDDLNVDITTIENNINILMSELEQKRASMSSMKDEYIQLKDLVFDENKLNGNLSAIANYNNELTKLNTYNGELRANIKFLRSDSKRIQDLIDNKVCPTCGQEIEVGKQNDIIRDNNEKIDEFIKIGISNSSLIDTIKEKISVLENEIIEINGIKDNIHCRQKLELKMTAVKTNIDNIKLQINNLIDIKNEYEVNKENIRYNNEMKLKISNIDISLNNETSIKENHIRQIEGYKSEISNYKSEIEKRKKLIEKLSEEEVIIRSWNTYLQLIGKNGIVKLILRNALPIINGEIERILDGLCDFKVKLTISDDNKVCIDMYRDGEKLDLGTCSSGFEGTFASLAIRSALASVATMAKPNFLTLDEIDATIAVSNYENLASLYHRILNNYQFIIHIAHNELLEGIHDKVITVYKEGNISKLMIK